MEKTDFEPKVTSFTEYGNQQLVVSLGDLHELIYHARDYGIEMERLNKSVADNKSDDVTEYEEIGLHAELVTDARNLVDMDLDNIMDNNGKI